MFDRLTEKQREVLAMVAENRTSKEIARALAISESAVVHRIESIRRLAHGAPRPELARLWRNHVAALSAKGQTCKPLTGQSSHIPEIATPTDSPDVDRPPAGDATVSVPASGSLLHSTDRSSIVPAALGGPQGTLLRVAMILLMAATMLLIVLSAITIAENLANLRRDGMDRRVAAPVESRHRTHR
ncbi:MAG: LuxR family transcriptional regulator [Sphingomonadales bacterium]|nr:LuxR family transcriptional regulator [Sphingomonadales bacterium]